MGVKLQIVQRLWFWILVTGGLVTLGWMAPAEQADPSMPYASGLLASYGWFAILVGTPVFVFLVVIALEDALSRRGARRAA